MSPSGQGRGKGHARRVPDSAGSHGEQRSLTEHIHMLRRRYAAGQRVRRGRRTQASQAEGSRLVSRAGCRGLFCCGMAAWLRLWGCAGAHACVIGRQAHRRGWLSWAEVEAGRVEGAGPQPSGEKPAVPGPSDGVVTCTAAPSAWVIAGPTSNHGH